MLKYVRLSVSTCLQMALQLYPVKLAVNAQKQEQNREGSKERKNENCHNLMLPVITEVIQSSSH